MLISAFPGRVTVLASLVAITGALPAVFGALVGRLVGQLPEAIHSGFRSAAGGHLTWTLVATGAVLVALDLAAGAQDVASTDRAAYLRDIGLKPHWAKELRIFGLVSPVGQHRRPGGGCRDDHHPGAVRHGDDRQQERRRRLDRERSRPRLIVEQGSHEDLMAAGGLYAELFELQARAYR